MNKFLLALASLALFLGGVAPSLWITNLSKSSFVNYVENRSLESATKSLGLFPWQKVFVLHRGNQKKRQALSKRGLRALRKGRQNASLSVVDSDDQAVMDMLKQAEVSKDTDRDWDEDSLHLQSEMAEELHKVHSF